MSEHYISQDLYGRTLGELESLKLLNAKLSDWNDAIRVTIDDYLNEKANKQDLKMVMTNWPTQRGQEKPIIKGRIFNHRDGMSELKKFEEEQEGGK